MNWACPPATASVRLGRRRVRPARSSLGRARRRFADEIDRAEVALVEPAVGLLGEDAGEAFAVQIDPLIGRAVEAVGQILQTLGVHFANGAVDVGFGVLEFDRRAAIS